MLLNGYLVRIPEGQEDSRGYVGLKHNQKYKIALRNGNATRCNVSIKIDGKNQGTWRMEAYDNAVLERPAHDQGCFTFYKLNSSEAQKVQLQDDSSLGLVEVIFIPEMRYPVANDLSVLEAYGTRSGSKSISYSSERSARNFSAGGTGLSGWSQQNFGQASEMPLDKSKTTTIYLRLVCIKDNTDEPRPLTNHTSPIPPRI
jgi:hypothetical protein